MCVRTDVAKGAIDTIKLRYTNIGAIRHNHSYHIRLIRCHGYYLFHHTIFVWLLFERGYNLRLAFIKLGTEDEEIHCLKEGGVAADARESIQRDTATLASVTDTELEESDPFVDFEDDEDELDENKLVLEDC